MITWLVSKEKNGPKWTWSWKDQENSFENFKKTEDRRASAYLYHSWRLVSNSFVDALFNEIHIVRKIMSKTYLNISYLTILNLQSISTLDANDYMFYFVIDNKWQRSRASPKCISEIIFPNRYRLCLYLEMHNVNRYKSNNSLTL